MSKIDSKKIMYYVLLVGVLALVVVYFLVYKKYIDETDRLAAENRSLSEKVAVLKEYYDNRLMYEEAINLMQSSIKSQMDEYPSDVLEEDILVLALDTMNDSVIGYSGINIGNREPVFDIDRGIVGKAKIEGLSDNLTFVNRVTQYTSTTDYVNLKLCIASILNSKNKKNIKMVTFSSNEDEGLLEGSIEVSFYSLLGSGKPYIPVELSDYEAGLYDLFGITSVTPEKDS